MIKEESCENIPEPEELLFDGVDSDNAVNSIALAIQSTKLFADNLFVGRIHFANMGIGFCKKYLVSPDALGQFAAQMAYMKVHGVEKPGSVYKTATSRRYYHGRTETIRSCSKAVVMFCRELVEHGDLNSAKLWQYFKDAMIEHVKLTSTCSRGKGADRHLLMLQTIAAKQGFTPEFFKDPMWKLSGGDAQFTLSSSFTGPFGEVGACAPMKKGGYGLFYSIDDETFIFSVTAFKDDFPLTKGEELTSNVEWSLEQLKALIENWASYEMRTQMMAKMWAKCNIL